MNKPISPPVIPKRTTEEELLAKMIKDAQVCNKRLKREIMKNSLEARVPYRGQNPNTENRLREHRPTSYPKMKSEPTEIRKAYDGSAAAPRFPRITQFRPGKVIK